MPRSRPAFAFADSQKVVAIAQLYVARLREALRGVARVMIEQRRSILFVNHESHNLDRRSLRSLLARVQGWIKQIEELVAEAMGREPPPKPTLCLPTS